MSYNSCVEVRCIGKEDDDSFWFNSAKRKLQYSKKRNEGYIELIHNGCSVLKQTIKDEKLNLIFFDQDICSETFVPSIKVNSKECYDWDHESFKRLQKDLKNCSKDRYVALCLKNIDLYNIPANFRAFLKYKICAKMLNNLNVAKGEEYCWVFLIHKPKHEWNNKPTCASMRPMVSNKVFGSKPNWKNFLQDIKDNSSLKEYQPNFDYQWGNNNETKEPTTWICLGECLSQSSAEIEYDLKK